MFDQRMPGFCTLLACIASDVSMVTAGIISGHKIRTRPTTVWFLRQPNTYTVENMLLNSCMSVKSNHFLNNNTGI